MNSNEPLTLYALNNMVRCTLNDAMPSRYWVTGELSEVRETTAGHCYIELVLRNEATGELVAKARGTIWARTYALCVHTLLKKRGKILVPD